MIYFLIYEQDLIILSDNIKNFVISNERVQPVGGGEQRYVHKHRNSDILSNYQPHSSKANRNIDNFGVLKKLARKTSTS